MTVLGFLSVITYLLGSLGTFRLLASAVDGGEEEEAGEEENEILELVETLHYGMFFVMVVFLVQVLAEVRDGMQASAEWCQWVSVAPAVSRGTRAARHALTASRSHRDPVPPPRLLAPPPRRRRATAAAARRIAPAATRPT